MLSYSWKVAWWQMSLKLQRGSEMGIATRADWFQLRKLRRHQPQAKERKGVGRGEIEGHEVSGRIRLCARQIVVGTDDVRGALKNVSSGRHSGPCRREICSDGCEARESQHGIGIERIGSRENL